MPSETAKRVYRQMSQEVCPWNERFSRALPDESPFRARAAIAGRDARAMAREWLAMTQAEFATRFKGSAMKRAKRRGLARNAAVALGNPSLRPPLSDAKGSGRPVDLAADVALLERMASQHDEPLVREHAAWALERLRAGGSR